MRLSESLVVYADSRFERIANSYARDTNRKATRIAALSDLPSTGVEVVVLSLAEATDADLDAMFEYGLNHLMPGFLPVGTDTRVELGRAVPRIRPPGGPARSRWIDFVGFSRFLGFNSGPRNVLSASASAQEMRDELSSDADLIRILTMSDGYDAFLGEGLSAFPLSTEASLISGHLPPGARVPTCLANDRCHRHGLPIDEARRAGNLFAVTDICCDILLWQSCRGMMVGTGPAPSLALGLALLQSRIKCLITTIDFVYSDLLFTEQLMMDLAEGDSVGTALASFSRSAIGKVHRLFAFGDPRTRIARPIGADRLLVTNKGPKVPSTLREQQGSMGFFSEYLSVEPDKQSVCRFIASKRWARWFDLMICIGTVEAHTVGICRQCGAHAQELQVRNCQRVAAPLQRDSHRSATN